jgi:hypothetical protein
LLGMKHKMCAPALLWNFLLLRLFHMAAPIYQKYECVLFKNSPFPEGKIPLPQWCAVSKGKAFIGWINARDLKATPTLQDALVFMDGCRSSSDACKQFAENTLTTRYLDHTAALVGGPVFLTKAFLA